MGYISLFLAISIIDHQERVFIIAMKKYSICGCLLLVIALILGACAAKEKVKNASSSDNAKSELGVTSFELKIDTADHKDAIEATLEIDGSRIDAVYVNRIEPKKLKGDKAYDELKPKIKDSDLTEDMSKDDVIEKVTKAFDVKDYTKFDLDVEFSDGKRKEFTDKKSKKGKKK